MTPNLEVFCSFPDPQQGCKQRLACLYKNADCVDTQRHESALTLSMIAFLGVNLFRQLALLAKHTVQAQYAIRLQYSIYFAQWQAQ